MHKMNSIFQQKTTNLLGCNLRDSRKQKQKMLVCVQTFFVNRHYDDVMLGLISQILLGYY